VLIDIDTEDVRCQIEASAELEEYDFSPDGSILYGRFKGDNARHHRVVGWDAVSGQKAWTIECESYVYKAAIDSSSALVALACGDGKCRVWNTLEKRWIAEWDCSRGSDSIRPRSYPNWCSFVDGGRSLIVKTAGTLRIFCVETLDLLSEHSGLGLADCSHCRGRVMIGLKRGKVLVLDCKTGYTLGNIQGPEKDVDRIRCSEYARYAIVTFYGGTMSFLDLESNLFGPVINWPYAHRIAMSDDGRWAVTADLNGTNMVLWDISIPKFAADFGADNFENGGHGYFGHFGCRSRVFLLSV